MARRPLALQLDDSSTLPIFAQIAAGIVGAIRAGRLAPGAPLPGSRALAASLSVHRNTVIAAYRELESQGWASGAQGRGTFVSRALPESRDSSSVAPGALAARPHFPLAPAPPEPAVPSSISRGLLSLQGGVPDLRLAPVDELARAYRRAVRAPGGATLDYGSEYGHPRLRAALAAQVNEARGLAATPEHVLVTRGSQMAFYLVARAVVEPGTVVAVEELGYQPAWEAFRAAGARLAPVPVDERGLRVDTLERLVQAEPVRAVYVTPHHQYPTIVGMAPERRVALLALAKKHRFAIVEDDYDHEIHFHGRPLLPLASADRHGSVVYVATLSKTLAPGVRVGYVVAPRPLVDRMALLRRWVDRQGDPALEHAVAELLEDGVVQRHARRMRRVYEERRNHLVAELEARLSSVVSAEAPSGGLALWARVAPEVNVDEWTERALREGVYVRPTRHFAFDGRTRPFLRLSYAPLTEREITEAVKRLRRALP